MKKKLLVLLLVLVSVSTIWAVGGFMGFGRGFRGSNEHHSNGSTQYQELLSTYPALAQTISELEARNVQVMHVEVGATSSGATLVKVEAREGSGTFDYLIDPSTGEILGRYAD